MMLWRAAALMAITFCMTVSLPPLVRRSLGRLLTSQRFGTSAPTGENGFMPERIVSSRALRRNIQGENVNYFNERKVGKICRAIQFVMPGLVPGTHVLARKAWMAGTKPGHDGP